MMAPALTSPLLAASGFRHAFFTRAGGVSQGAYGTLNFAWSTGDDEAKVRENLRRGAEMLGVEPAHVFFLSQVHGKTVRRVDRSSVWDDVVRWEGDAVVSDDARVACGVRAADCVPILVADRESGVVCAIHSGWRGTVLDVVGAAIDALRALAGKKGDLVAAVGPHIALASFEVGEEVAREIETATPSKTAIDRSTFAKPHVDLRSIVDAQLRAAGVAAVDHVEGDTYADRENFFSFRRDGQKSGRHLAAIVPRAAG